MASRVAWVAVGAIVGGLIWYVAQSMAVVTSGRLTLVSQRRLEQAVWAVEANLDGMADAGYVRWTPSGAARELVAVLNAAQVPDPQEEAMRQGGFRPPPPTEYVLGRATKPGQVVLIPDDARNVIRIEAYGSDLSQPVIVKEVSPPS